MGSVFSVRPTQWELDHAHALIAGIRYAESHGGVIPINAFWRDLERRYDRNPNAFAINHPNFKMFLDGLIIEGRASTRPAVPHHGWIGHMRHGGTLAPLTVQPEPPAVASVPEPASAAMWCLGLAVVVAWLARGSVKNG